MFRLLFFAYVCAFVGAPFVGAPGLLPTALAQTEDQLAQARAAFQRGVEAYGADLLSTKVSLAEFMNRFHGHNERIDIESLQLTTKLWLDIMDRFWR